MHGSTAHRAVPECMRMIDHRRCRYRRNLGCALKETEAERQECGSLPVGEEAEVADAHEAARQQMEQKTAQELFDGQSHEPLLVAVSGVSPAKGDVVIGESY